MRLKKQGYKQITVSVAAINPVSVLGYLKNKISLVNESGVFSCRNDNISFIMKQYCRGGLAESTKHASDNKAYRKLKYSEGNSYSLKRGKWRAATLVNTLKMAKIR